MLSIHTALHDQAARAQRGQNPWRNTTAVSPARWAFELLSSPNSDGVIRAVPPTDRSDVEQLCLCARHRSRPHARATLRSATRRARAVLLQLVGRTAAAPSARRIAMRHAAGARRGRAGGRALERCGRAAVRWPWGAARPSMTLVALTTDAPRPRHRARRRRLPRDCRERVREEPEDRSISRGATGATLDGVDGRLRRRSRRALAATRIAAPGGVRARQLTVLATSGSSSTCRQRGGGHDRRPRRCSRELERGGAGRHPRRPDGRERRG